MNALILTALLTVSVAPEFVTGVDAPAVDVVDENGRVRSSAGWRGTPTIVAPLFTRCPIACPLIVNGIKRGTGESSASAAEYRVVLLSFDPRDTPDDLRRFRERNRIPLSWNVVIAPDGGERRLLDAIGYRYADAGGVFTHPNAIVVLTRDGKTAKWLHGTSYDGRAIDEALTIAAGRRDWVAQFGPWLLALLIFIAILAAVSMLVPRSRSVSMLRTP